MNNKNRQFIHKNEVIPEESEDENDTLFELKNFKKLNLNKRKPLVKNAPTAQAIKVKKTPKNTKLKAARSRSSPRETININKNVENNDNDIINEEEDAQFIGRPRVERFLSIFEVPPEVLLYQQQIQQKYGGQSEMEETNKNKVDIDSKIRKTSKNLVNLKLGAAKKKPESTDKNKNMPSKFYRNGNGLPQQVRAEIIRSIIKNFNLDKYINQFKTEYVVEIELDKK